MRVCPGGYSPLRSSKLNFSSTIPPLLGLGNLKGPDDLRFFWRPEHCGEPKLAELVSPYSYYSDKDIKERSIYVEASRGCPFRYEFCLSSLDLAVRQFSLDAFLADMQMLIDKGALQFKFIDRTFNFNPRISSSILRFFLEHMEYCLDNIPRLLSPGFSCLSDRNLSIGMYCVQVSN